MTTPGAAPKTFRGECPRCDKVAEFEEAYREKRAAGSPMAAARGEFKTVHEWSFRCGACGQRSEKVMDDAGRLHKWTGSRHAIVDVGG